MAGRILDYYGNPIVEDMFWKDSTRESSFRVQEVLQQAIRSLDILFTRIY